MCGVAYCADINAQYYPDIIIFLYNRIIILPQYNYEIIIILFTYNYLG